MDKLQICDAPICAPEMEINQRSNGGFIFDTELYTYKRNCSHDDDCECYTLHETDFTIFCRKIENLESLKNFLYEYQCIHRCVIEGNLENILFSEDTEIFTWYLKEFYPKVDNYWFNNVYYLMESVIREGYLSVIQWMLEFYNISAEEMTAKIGYHAVFYSACKSGDLNFIKAIIDLCGLTNDQINFTIKNFSNDCTHLASSNYNDNVEIITWMLTTFESTEEIIQRELHNCIESAVESSNFNIAEWYINTYGVSLIDVFEESYHVYTHERYILRLIERNEEKTAVWAARMLNIPDEILIKFPKIYEACKENESMVKFAGKLT